MATTGKIETGRGIEAGTITARISGGTFEQWNCYKIDNVVYVAARQYGISVASTSYVATVPEGFRPREITRIPGYVMVNNSLIVTTMTIYPDGTVGSQYGSTNMTQYGFWGCYPI